MQASRAPRLSADVGGTFTDVVLESRERVLTAKVLTTHASPAAGVMEGIRRVLREGGVAPDAVGAVIHGTTLAANAIIERRGARTALLVTQGHRDALETGYENRFDQYDITVSKPEPLVPRRRRWPVVERIGAAGQVLEPLDEGSVTALIEKLRAQQIESVAIGLLHSYINPLHEQRVAELLNAAIPELWISLSSEVSPQIREYERLSTASANAYVQPLIASYLRDLKRQLTREGFRCPLLLVMSSGGLTTVESAVRFPVRLVESGPAGGAVLASEVARRAGYDEVIAFDMGGTTAKLCLIDKGSPQYAKSFEVDRIHRFVRGSGLPLCIPTVEVVEIGAGGGSLASVDVLGRLRMGPQSAGPDPGPACYGRGGAHATVTDADLVLGRIDGRGFAGGLLDLDADAARRAVAADVGALLGLDARAAAEAMSEVVDEAMANAARVHAVESGKHVSGRTLIAFGGAAPLHAARVAEKLGISRVVIPVDAGVGSAVGFLLAPVSFEVTRTWLTGLDRLDEAHLAETIDSMRIPLSALVGSAAPQAEQSVELRAYLRYAAQAHEVEVHLPLAPKPTALRMRAAFEERYLALYGSVIPHVPINLVSLALRVSTARPSSPWGGAVIAGTSVSAERAASDRSVGGRLPEGRGDPSAAAIPIAMLARAELPSGFAVDGPVLIAEPQTTTRVPAGTRATIDTWGNIILTRAVAT